MAGLGRSQGSKYGMRGMLAATLGFLLGAFGSKNDVDALRAGNSQGFPLAKKYLRTLDPLKATGRTGQGINYRANVGYNWDGPRARRVDVSVSMMDTKEARNARREAETRRFTKEVRFA